MASLLGDRSPTLSSRPVCTSVRVRSQRAVSRCRDCAGVAAPSAERCTQVPPPVPGEGAVGPAPMGRPGRRRLQLHVARSVPSAWTPARRGGLASVGRGCWALQLLPAAGPWAQASRGRVVFPVEGSGACEAETLARGGPGLPEAGQASPSGLLSGRHSPPGPRRGGYWTLVLGPCSPRLRGALLRAGGGRARVGAAGRARRTGHPWGAAVPFSSVLCVPLVSAGVFPPRAREAFWKLGFFLPV